MSRSLRFLTMAALVLLPLAACDNSTDTGTAPAVTGTISGTVTIDGAGATGITVTLSSGKTATTAATGAYSIADVPAGAYTVTISGQPTDVTFPATVQAAVVATAGQVVTVNFAGARIRTSSIVGSVTSTSAGQPVTALANVAVAITGTESKSATTDASGQYSATGMRAGTYTVAITAPTGQTCATTSQSVTVAAGETKIASFSCTPATTARITGRLTNSETGENLLIANVQVVVEGPSGTTGTRTLSTDATGTYNSTGLVAGSYTVRVVNSTIPATIIYNGPSFYSVTVAAGATATQNITFSSASQSVKIFTWMGRNIGDAAVSATIPVSSAATPLRGAVIQLYPTLTDYQNLTNVLGEDTTKADGSAVITFARNATAIDRIVYARLVPATPVAGYYVSGSNPLVFQYTTNAAVTTAPSNFSLLYPQALTTARARGALSGEALAGWFVELWRNDTTAAAIQQNTTDPNGYAVIDRNLAPGGGGVASLPDTAYLKFKPAASQPAALGHTYTATLSGIRGTVRGSYLRFVNLGVTSHRDTVVVGEARLSFVDTDVNVRVYHEADDTLRFTTGDDGTAQTFFEMQLLWRQAGASTDSSRILTAGANTAVGAAPAVATFLNVPTGQSNYRLRGYRLNTGIDVLNDTLLTVGAGGNLGELRGGFPATYVCPLGTANTAVACGTFQYKYNNTSIRVAVTDTTRQVVADSIQIRIRGLATSIQPGIAGRTLNDTTLTTTTTAARRTLANLREGQYTVQIISKLSGTDTIWAVRNASRLDTVRTSLAGTTALDSPYVAARFTTIAGVVQNAPAGITLTLYRNNSGCVWNGAAGYVYSGCTSFTYDTTVTTTTTDALGGYIFRNLREGRYAVRVTDGTTVTTIAKGFSSSSGRSDSLLVRTTAAAPTNPNGAEGLNLTRYVGSTDPTLTSTNGAFTNNCGADNTVGLCGPRPNWDTYNDSTDINRVVPNQTRNTASPAYFMALWKNTTVSGEVVQGATGTTPGAPIAGMRVQIRRCLTNASGGQAGTQALANGSCTAATGFYTSGAFSTTLEAITDAAGHFVFTGLTEGMYEVRPNPFSVSGYSTTTNASALYRLIGNGASQAFTFLANP